MHNPKKKCNFATQNAFFVKKSILFILFSLFVSTLSAQNATSFYCDFEDSTVNAQWVLNAGNKGLTSQNQWHLGDAGSFGVGSTQGLYIADEQNPSVSGYAATDFSCYQVAYCPLPLRAGTYTIQFDWKGLGQSNDEMLVFWTPGTTNIFSNWNNSDQSLPTWTGINNAIHVRGKANWQSYQGTLQVNATGGRLVVIWANKKGVPTNPAGAIDNIRIYQGTPCAAPTTVSYNMKTKELTWTGNGYLFDVLVFNSQTNSFSEYLAQTQSSLKISDLTEEGMYYFYVRSNCGDSLHTSGWKSCNQFVWIPDARCLDFMDLDGAKCYRGPFDDVTGGSGSVMHKVDHGYESVESFHTLHYVPGEKDPRTKNMLTTVPAGEIASVRLGNWRDDSSIGGMGAGEAIEYTYRVKAGQSDIMEINYAVVMEKPGHNNGTDPHFTLEILDRNGKQIGGAASACFMADFAAASNNPAALVGWNELLPAQLPGVEGVGSDNIIWKPWTLISVSLRNYVGQTLTIRLTTKDCRQSAHWAYAYFTIGCRSGDLEGIACGDYSTDHFDAPEGFYYRWYWEGEPNNVLGTDSRFDITSTTDSVYVCDVISKTSGGCYYSLTANPNPRFPRAITSVKDQTPRNCENRVKFDNESRVYFINRKTGSDMPTQHTEPVESVFWNWGDGSSMEENNDEEVEHVFPITGGTFRVMTIASMSGGVCQDTAYTDVVLPNITAVPEAEEINLCRAETPTYKLPDGSVVSDDTSFSTFTKNKYGCDVEMVHHLFFRDSAQSVKDTVFCEGGYIDFEGKKYTETGTYKVPLKTIYGCDSTMELNLTVIPTLQIGVDPVFTVCGDGTLDIPFDIIKGRYSGMKVHLGDSVYSFGVDDPISIPMYNELTDSYLRPDLYDVTLEFGTADCPADPVHVKANVMYASFIMYQKHGFIGLYNSDYNTYGIEFDKKYTWYCNDELMPNDTLAYIRVKDSDWGKKYRVDVTRKDDGKVMTSCPLTYTYGMPQDVENIVPDEEVVAYFDIFGRCYATLPKQKGVYVVVYSKHVEKVVVE